MRDERGRAIGFPLWYGWDGSALEMFAEREAPVVLRLEEDAHASVLVTNIPPEPPRWVSLEGRIAIEPDRGQETAARLSERYLIDPVSVAASLKRLRNADLVRLCLVPDCIRSHAEIA